VEWTFAWEDKFKRLLLRFEFKQQRHHGMKLMAYTLINLGIFVVPEIRNHVWTAPWVQEPRRDFDGRFDCDHVSGLKRGAMTAGPDGVRDPVPNS
jgi:hypothetical protein